MTQTTDSLPSTTDVDPDADLQRVQPDLVGTQTERLADDPDHTARYPGIPGVINGNGALAHVMKNVCGGVIGYPITPSTEISELYEAARAEGGDAAAFLSRNRCPATVMLRRSAWAATPGYDESMRGGFEDWDFFLTLLSGGGRITIVPEPLIGYRTAPASANITSMNARTALLGQIIDKHLPLYREHVRAAVLDLDAVATAHLRSWEALATADPTIALDEATYGDGGMAAVVRAETARATS